MEKRLSIENIAKFPNLLLLEVGSDNSEIVHGFRERLKTFIDNRNWISHQSWLYPTICAQYGWKCVTNQLLQCETCYSNLSPATSNLCNITLHNTYVENTFKKLKTAHQKHCPWPHTPCPDHFVRMYSIHKEEAYQVFIKRLKSLYSLREQLPRIKEEAVKKIGLSEDVCSSLCKISFVLENNFSTSAVLLSATGWSKDSEAKLKDKLLCQSCQRSVSLLMYTSVVSDMNNPDKNTSKENCVSQSTKNEDIRTESDNSSINTNSQKENLISPQLKKRKSFTFFPEPFDPLYEHRSWCPWLIDSVENVKNTDSATNNLVNTENISGWQLFIKCLLRNIKCSDKNSSTPHEPLKNQLKRARDMLESWNSPCIK